MFLKIRGRLDGRRTGLTSWRGCLSKWRGCLLKSRGHPANWRGHLWAVCRDLTPVGGHLSPVDAASTPVAAASTIVATASSNADTPSLKADAPSSAVGTARLNVDGWTVATEISILPAGGCIWTSFLKRGAAAGAPVCDRLKPFRWRDAFNVSFVAATMGGWTR